VQFYVNGVATGGEVPLPAGVEAGALRPAVSLYRQESKAVMRCCREDWSAPRAEVASFASFCGR
jgi:hypothetical protein